MFDHIIQGYVLEFYEKGEPLLKTICNCKVPSDIVLMKYKELPPIETMPEKEKKELKQYVIDMFPEKTIEEKLDCCKIIHTIGNLL